MEYLTKEQVQDKVNKTMDLSTKEFKEMLKIQYGDNIIAQRQLQTLRNTLKNGTSSAGKTQLETMEKLIQESRQLMGAINSQGVFSAMEKGDFMQTLSRHTKRLIRYAFVDKIQGITQDHLTHINNLLSITQQNKEVLIDTINQDRIRQKQRQG